MIKKTNSKRITLRSLFSKDKPINVNVSLFLSKIEEKTFEIETKIKENIENSDNNI